MVWNGKEGRKEGRGGKEREERKGKVMFGEGNKNECFTKENVVFGWINKWGFGPSWYNRPNPHSDLYPNTYFVPYEEKTYCLRSYD